MASAPSRIVIVGASLGGASAAVGLRERGFDGEVVLIGAEDHLPYERPPLSKALLLGERDEPDWDQDAGYYEAHGIELVRRTVVTAVDRQRHVVTTAGAEHPYDKLLLATGSTPRRLGMPGDQLDGIVTLRTWDDALALRKRLIAGANIVIVGAGWIGCEVAAAARHHGASVTVIEPASQPLVRVVGEQVGEGRADLLPDDPDEWLGRRLYDRHRSAVMTGSCGHLAADPAGPDDHDVRACDQPLAQRECVVPRSERDHAVELVARHAEPTRSRPGGE